MASIVEFLEARLGEDERGGNPHADESMHRPNCWSVLHSASSEECTCDGPVRVLREVATKRAIIGLTLNLVDGDPDDFTVLRYLAAIYQDHADFDPAWAVEAAAVKG